MASPDRSVAHCARLVPEPETNEAPHIKYLPSMLLVRHITRCGDALKDTVLSHDIKFEITTSGNVTPSWTLTRVTVNPSGPFFSTSRDRTHDLTITLGPGDKTGFLGRAAADASVSIQIGNAVASSIQSLAVRPTILSPF
jgi:hypothetical protein